MCALGHNAQVFASALRCEHIQTMMQHYCRIWLAALLSNSLGKLFSILKGKSAMLNVTSL